MPLHIRNPEAEELAREVASLANESLTNAVIIALKDRLERLKGQKGKDNLIDDLRVIAKRCAALPDHDTRSVDEILGYNEYGGFGDH